MGFGRLIIYDLLNNTEQFYKEREEGKSLERTIKSIKIESNGSIDIGPKIKREEKIKKYKEFLNRPPEAIVSIYEGLNENYEFLMECKDQEIEKTFGEWQIYNKEDLGLFYDILFEEYNNVLNSEQEKLEVKKELISSKKDLEEISNSIDPINHVVKGLFKFVTGGCLGYASLEVTSATMELVRDETIKTIVSAEEFGKYIPGFGLAIVVTALGVMTGMFLYSGVSDMVGSIRAQKGVGKEKSKNEK